MPAIIFRKRQCFTDIARQALTERIVPAFHVGGFARLFADRLVRVRGKDRRIRLPEITETPAAAIRERNSSPEASATPFAVIANDEGDNLTCPTTQNGPQPALPRPFAHKRPDLIDLQPVIGMRWTQGLRQ